MNNKENVIISFCMLFALALPLLGAVRYEAELKTHPVVRFEIEPYDPRDLLYGHYLQFRIRWNWNPEKNVYLGNSYNKDNVCLCVGKGEINPPVHAASCDGIKKKEENCVHAISGGYYSRFETGGTSEQEYSSPFDRFYVDERYALALEKIFRDHGEQFHIGLSMRDGGDAVIKDLYVGGKSLADYIRDNPDLATQQED